MRHLKSLAIVSLAVACTLVLSACSSSNCAKGDMFCRYQQGDFASYPECSGKHESCYTRDKYKDLSCPWVRELGSCYHRTTDRFFYFDENGRMFGEVNIDYGENEGNLSHAIFLFDSTKTFRGFYRNNKPMYVSVGGNDMPYVGYFEDDGALGRIQFKELGVDVLFDKDGSCRAHEGLRSFGDMGGFTCDQLKKMAADTLSKYGLKL